MVGASLKAARVWKKVDVPMVAVAAWVPRTNPISVDWKPAPGLLSLVGIFSTEKV